MKILHLFPEDNQLIADHVALLRNKEESFTGRPDIIHVHGCWRYSIVRQALRYYREGARIVLSPHGELEPWIVAERRLTEKFCKTLLWQRRLVEKSYVQIVHGPMEEEALRALNWNPRMELIRNAVVTNTITPESMLKQTINVYRKVLDSNTIELMDDNCRLMLSLLLKAGITMAPQWVTTSLPTIADSDWRKLLIYANYEQVLPTVDRGISVLGIHPPYPDLNNIKSYLPSNYISPKVESHDVTGIVSEMHHGPLTLRQFVELDCALRQDDINDEELSDKLMDKGLFGYFQRLLKILQEQTGLDEGFLPAIPINDKRTARLRRQLIEHLRI